MIDTVRLRCNDCTGNGWQLAVGSWRLAVDGHFYFTGRAFGFATGLIFKSFIDWQNST
jgi:hypothetical protein